MASSGTRQTFKNLSSGQPPRHAIDDIRKEIPAPQIQRRSVGGINESADVLAGIVPIQSIDDRPKLAPNPNVIRSDRTSRDQSISLMPDRETRSQTIESAANWQNFSRINCPHDAATNGISRPSKPNKNIRIGKYTRFRILVCLLCQQIHDNTISHSDIILQ